MWGLPVQNSPPTVLLGVARVLLCSSKVF